MSRAGIVIALLAGVTLLGVGAYFVYGKFRCNALRDDVLNSAESMRQSAMLGTLFPADTEAQAGRDELRKIQARLLEMRMLRVYEECGDRAGQSAAREASDMILSL